jgi:hypothetical protein
VAESGKVEEAEDKLRVRLALPLNYHIWGRILDKIRNRETVPLTFNKDYLIYTAGHHTT